jgi:hypothetical protein
VFVEKLEQRLALLLPLHSGGLACAQALTAMAAAKNTQTANWRIITSTPLLLVAGLSESPRTQGADRRALQRVL